MPIWSKFTTHKFALQWCSADVAKEAVVVMRVLPSAGRNVWRHLEVNDGIFPASRSHDVPSCHCSHSSTLQRKEWKVFFLSGSGTLSSRLLVAQIDYLFGQVVGGEAVCVISETWWGWGPPTFFGEVARFSFFFCSTKGHCHTAVSPLQPEWLATRIQTLSLNCQL